jgi:hypothetical protein
LSLQPDTDRVRLFLALALLVVAGAALVYFRPYDPHMSSAELERVLQARVGPRVDVSCSSSQSNDGSLGLDDVDYACVFDYGDREKRFWVGTDWNRITGMDGEEG